jgi:hypothetical protein
MKLVVDTFEFCTDGFRVITQFQSAVITSAKLALLRAGTAFTLRDGIEYVSWGVKLA